jgi:hypothetical protein
MKKYSLSFPGSGLLLVKDNWLGDQFCFPMTSTYVYMKVEDATDYTFYFKFNMVIDEVVIPVTSLNDIAGTAPVSNNAATDFAAIVSRL